MGIFNISNRLTAGTATSLIVAGLPGGAAAVASIAPGQQAWAAGTTAIAADEASTSSSASSPATGSRSTKAAAADKVETDVNAEAKPKNQTKKTVLSQSCSTARAKGSWARKGSQDIGYHYKDGRYLTRITRIGTSVYLFKANGKLDTSHAKLRIINVKGKKFGAAPSGKLVKGWQCKDGRLYYFAGTYLKGKSSGKRGGIRFAADGSAVNDLNTALKLSTVKVLRNIVRPHMNKQQKLRAIWNYMVSKKRWRYATPYTSFAFLNSNSWAKRYAYQMLNTKQGKCYGFACCFAALAYEAGFKDVRIAVCRIPGTPDHAADGYTHHGLVQLNGLWYDPEAQFEGWLKDIYGKRQYPFSMKSLDTRAFSTYTGTGKPRGISPSFNKKVKLTIVRSGGYYCGSESLQAPHGLYYCRKHLYKFDSKGRMRVSAYHEVERAMRAKQPWKTLRKLIGAPNSHVSLDSCAGAGKDVIYQYDHVQVSTFKPIKGGTETITAVNSR